MLQQFVGHPYPLGATWDGRGVNFAVFSENAASAELCLFSQTPRDSESARFMLRGRTGDVWHTYLEGLKPGTVYGYRADGSYLPREAHRFNRHKLLLDPYAKATTGKLIWDDALYGYVGGDPREDLSFDARDSSAFVPKSVVVDPTFDWRNDKPPEIPWERTVIYECHVKGLTARHPGVPPELRGTYLGLASEPIIRHLTELGVTAVELLPVFHFVDQRTLARHGLVNYWGYNTIGYFAPEARYASAGEGRQVAEFKIMVQALHRAGIEVILDVVYNHTGEGDRLGPTLCMRGLDNASYYRLKPNDLREYENVTGCGNTINLGHPRVLQMVMDSLRYWVQDMHVDGFRFDLATVLLRNDHGLDPRSSFLTIVQQDPVLSKVKLIAEPWDLGADGYQLGRFPPPWAEWNDQYRDVVRKFWRGDPTQIALLASRVSGSRDIFSPSRRRPCASVNFVTCHDGFTLQDLTAYQHKRNEANGEHNRDGTDHNHSRNWGAEGPTDDPTIRALRERVQRSLLATLAVSRGVVMLTAGDELGRTQHGNNNAYCQDNGISWLDWDLDESRRELLAFVQRIFALRRAHPALRHDEFFYGVPVSTGIWKDVTWLRPDGGQMTLQDWHDAQHRFLAMLIHDGEDGGGAQDTSADPAETLLVIFNADEQVRRFTFPNLKDEKNWCELLDTATPGNPPRIVNESYLDVLPQGLLVLELR